MSMGKWKAFIHAQPDFLTPSFEESEGFADTLTDFVREHGHSIGQQALLGHELARDFAVFHLMFVADPADRGAEGMLQVIIEFCKQELSHE